jgi:hypothetical protein
MLGRVFGGTMSAQKKRNRAAWIKFVLTVSISMAVEFSCTRVVQNVITEPQGIFKPYEAHVDSVLFWAAPETLWVEAAPETVLVSDASLTILTTEAALPETVFVLSDARPKVEFVELPPETVKVVVHDTTTVQPPPMNPWKIDPRRPRKIP